MSDYPNNTLLVDTDWMNHHLNDHPNVRILDVRVTDPRLQVGYRMGHIPGAIAFDPSRELFIRTQHGRDVAAVEKIAESLGQRGISAESLIVIYDEWTGQLATMTFWVLRLLGHVNLRILHGGWALWQKSGGATSLDVPEFAPTSYHAQPNQNYRADADWIQANVSRPDVLLLDSRSTGEYEMGHIPGAVNLSWDLSLDPQMQNFKDPATLRAQLESVGATPEKEIIAYCATGARSSHMFTTLSLMGYSRIRNYDGSMMDWYQVRGLPVE